MKTKLLSLKKHLTTLLIASCLVYTAQASNDFENNQNFDNPFEEWILQADVNGVKAYSRVTTCNDKSVVFMKFESSLSGSIKIEWKDSVLLTDPSGGEVKIETDKSKVFYLNDASASASSCENEPNIQLVFKFDTGVKLEAEKIEGEEEDELSLASFSIKSYSFKDLTITIN